MTAPLQKMTGRERRLLRTFSALSCDIGKASYKLRLVGYSSQASALEAALAEFATALDEHAESKEPKP